jgi:uncharacterized phage-associated protein
MLDFPFNKEKSIATMLHICNTLGGEWDKYSLLKIVYFAEQKHLAKYGRPITGDNIVALAYGPVPSISYDEIKYSKVNPQFFTVNDNVVTANVMADLDLLSETDLECITEAINENKNLSFGAIKDKSHDAAYNWTLQNLGSNEVMPYTEIAKAAGASAEMLAYIASTAENYNLCLHG